MAKSLVIVESPAKAKKIGEYLGADFVVESSVGHIRDLPSRASEIPEAYKSQAWSRLGVNVDDDFKPIYVVNAAKRDVVRRLKQLLKGADELLLATDEDREGEAIAWHLLEELSPRVPVKRMVFHEITQRAIREAAANPRDIDRRLVDAQETRRILDRLYGYEVSPVLWKKVMANLSAGRVQSVATRLVVERERERIAFRVASYWDVEGRFSAREGDTTEFGATLSAVDGRSVATSRDFGPDGAIATGRDVVPLDEAAAASLVAGLDGATFAVRSLERKPKQRSPRPPFITSTLQQACSGKLRMSASQTMAAAQRLYENGYITYMRTDSVVLSEDALRAARAVVVQRFGDDYLPPQARTYEGRVKNAQEAHEAIRPAGETFRSPDDVASEVSATDARVYELIWRRTVASQMVNARQEQTTMILGAAASDGRDAEFKATGTVTVFPGYLAAYDELASADEAGEEDLRLPRLAEGTSLEAVSLEAKGHETSPPGRYSEAALIRRLEELGVGRPSTYASIIQTILDRGYVWKKGSALVPTWVAFSVVNLLERHFPDLVDYAFTARMEDDLDAIANGDEEMIPWLRRFYFGNGTGPGLRRLVTDHVDEIDAAAINTFPLGLDADGNEVVVKPGRYGPYVKRGDDTASVPDDLPPDELTLDRALELLAAPREGRELGTDAATGLTVFAKPGRFGPYVQLGDAESLTDGEKPKTASLFKSMSLDTVTLDEALRLLSLPRVVGTDPADGVEITTQNGRYGPYVRKGTDSRSLATEEEIFELSLDGALALLAQPKWKAKAAARRTSEPLRTLGDDAVSGKPITVRDGRFGPYVTDGETNASLRKGDTVEEITTERASELLQIRRDAGPAKKRSAKRAAGARQPAAKKRAAKKKAAAKKRAAPPAE